MATEKTYRAATGWLALIMCPVVFFGGLAVLINTATDPALKAFGVPTALLLMASAVVLAFGFVAIAPNDARVLLLFGNYKGSITESGFYWVNPFFSKKRISRRVRSFETGSVVTPERKNNEGKVVQKKLRTSGRPSKVNDRDGNPIEISAVVVWRVVDTAEALFEVDDYEDFVAVQSEAALRNLASRHPYDGEDHNLSLRGNTQAICGELRQDIQDRLETAGVEVVEARISHLAYAPEIAAAMLQRQQAQAVVAARSRIVDGAVGMVEMALERLVKEGIVDLDDEKRASMVSNLLVVLCSDRHTQPVVNTGTLYN